MHFPLFKTTHVFYQPLPYYKKKLNPHLLGEFSKTQSLTRFKGRRGSNYVRYLKKNQIPLMRLALRWTQPLYKSKL